MASADPRIVQWLVSVDSTFKQHDSSPTYPISAPKRKIENLPMEDERDPDPLNETPRPPKKPRSTAYAEPAPPTTLHGTEGGQTFDSVSSISESTTSTESHASSPTKRKIELEFVVPRVIFKSRQLWIQQRSTLETKLPLLKSLLSAVAVANRYLPKGLEVRPHNHLSTALTFSRLLSVCSG